MNYWHMNLHPTGGQGTDEEIRNIVLSRTIGMGIFYRKDGEIDPQVTDFKKRVKIGDIVAILNGLTPIALVEVIGDWYEFDRDSNSIIWFPLRRSVRILCVRGGENDDYIAKLPPIPMSRTKTLTISIGKDTDTYQYIHAWYEYCRNRA